MNLPPPTRFPRQFPRPRSTRYFLRQLLQTRYSRFHYFLLHLFTHRFLSLLRVPRHLSLRTRFPRTRFLITRDLGSQVLSILLIFILHLFILHHFRFLLRFPRSRLPRHHTHHPLTHLHPNILRAKLNGAVKSVHPKTSVYIIDEKTHAGCVEVIFTVNMIGEKRIVLHAEDLISVRILVSKDRVRYAEVPDSVYTIIRSVNV